MISKLFKVGGWSPAMLHAKYQGGSHLSCVVYYGKENSLTIVYGNKKRNMKVVGICFLNYVLILIVL